MNERLTRIELLLGAEKLAKIQSSSVTIVGLGAVGGFALEALARSGVGCFRLVDFDLVSTSNINRQLLALSSTIGRPKVEVARERILEINPDCQVETMQCFAHNDTFDKIFDFRPNLIIDAIDSFNPKVELLSYIQSKKLPVIASMGAALQMDPSCIKTDKLTRSTYCPLARLIRKHLRRRGFGTDFWCVYSTEPRAEIGVIDSIVQSSCDFCYERGRTRNTLGSLPTVTGIFGLTIANKALELLTE